MAGPDIGAMAVVPATRLSAAETNTITGASNAVILGAGIGNDLNVTGASTVALKGSAFTQTQLGNTTFGDASTLNLTSDAGQMGKSLRIGGTAVFGSGVDAESRGRRHERREPLH